MGQPSASIGPDLLLTVSFKEAGLGANQNIDYTVNRDFIATYQYYYNSGKHPKAGNKEITTGDVLGTGRFNSGKNSNVQGSITTQSGLNPGSFTYPSG